MVTVFTPVYNREKEILELYKSLLRQTSKDFEWIVVDDGSKDDIVDQMEKLIDETDSFTIRFFCQSNAGKHVAINKGVQMAKGEYFIIVDSDDYLVDNAIETILAEFSNIPGDYAGIGLQRITPQGLVIGKTFKGDFVDATTSDRPKYGIEGDKAEVFFTHVMRRYPFPVFKGENFLSEACVWYKMSADGLLIRWINKPAVVCEYLAGGLTDNSFSLALKNFEGSTYKANVMLKCKLPIETRIKTIGNYIYIGVKKRMPVSSLAKKIHISLPEAFMCYYLCILKKALGNRKRC